MRSVREFCGWVTVLACTLSGCSTTSTLAERQASAKTALSALQKLDLGAARTQTRAQIAAAPVPAGEGAPSPTEQLDDAYQKMMSYCSSTLTKFERRSDNLTYWSVAVAVVGSLAGSVAVPALTAASAANKATVAALGGLSGSANAGQQALSGGGITSASILQTRETVLTNWKTDIKDYFDSTKSLDEQRRAVEKSFGDCQLYEISTTNQGAQK
jgi:hypothetical protein